MRRSRLAASIGTGLMLLVLPGCGTVKSPTEPLGAPHTVAVSNFQFTPSTLTVHVGDTVTWVNQGGFHNVAADDGSYRCSEGCVGATGDPSSAAWTFTRTFSQTGRVPYHCEVHGAPGGVGMSGVIVVEANP